MGGPGAKGRSARLRAVCFDFDGVIVDSEPLHYESERVVLAARGIAFSVAEKTRFVGGTVRGTVESICAHYGIGDPDVFFNERQAAFDALVASSLALMPGARAALVRLKDAGIPLALVSSGERGYIDAALARHELGSMFDFTVTQQDVVRHKPDPEPYLAAVSLLGMAPSQCMAVEDSPTGVAAAKAAGLICVAIPSPATADADFSAADIRLGSLLDLDGGFVSGFFSSSP
jgi:HAD superfamily hydrolase (TIGR01509 family)